MWTCFRKRHSALSCLLWWPARLLKCFTTVPCFTVYRAPPIARSRFGHAEHSAETPETHLICPRSTRRSDSLELCQVAPQANFTAGRRRCPHRRFLEGWCRRSGGTTPDHVTILHTTSTTPALQRVCEESKTRTNRSSCTTHTTSTKKHEKQESRVRHSSSTRSSSTFSLSPTSLVSADLDTAAASSALQTGMRRSDGTKPRVVVFSHLSVDLVAGCLCFLLPAELCRAGRASRQARRATDMVLNETRTLCVVREAPFVDDTGLRHLLRR